MKLARLPLATAIGVLLCAGPLSARPFGPEAPEAPPAADPGQNAVRGMLGMLVVVVGIAGFAHALQQKLRRDNQALRDERARARSGGAPGRVPPPPRHPPRREAPPVAPPPRGGS